MKKAIGTLAVLLMCLLLPNAAAFADGESAAQRGLELIRTARNRDSIVLPQDSSWLDEWKTLYTRKAWYAPNLPVETMPMTGSGIPQQGYICEGTEVTVVAEESDMSCIVYRNHDYKTCVGWIQSVRLLEEFPGPTCMLGEARTGDFETRHDVPQRWSGEWLPGTQQQYTVLDETLKDCVGFTFEYQLTAENIGFKDMVMGERTLWISDGENWTPLGVFPYWENGAVRVQVWLDEPTDIAAVAARAHCQAPDIFDFRETATDFLFEK